ncbi:MAG TPA: zf-TFIIB domain-containing protein [Gemmatimonadaceae bacterium]|nr:zf-TFIIB domain-containing protein [Gemmatimonadaceae bacterium]
MDAQALTCPQCGAAADSNATSCAFCQARLATVACSKCYGLVFIGSKHCGHCGAEMKDPDAVAATAHRCPRGCGALREIRLGTVDLEECERCVGMWVRQDEFQRIYAEEEHGAVVLGPELSQHRVQGNPLETVRYVPCPECGKLMNRINFAKRSGVILDSCGKHGTWFDADELRRVVEFIRKGGLDQLRTHEKMYLAEERRLLELKQRLSDPSTHDTMSRDNAGSNLRLSAIDGMRFLFGER